MRVVERIVFTGYFNFKIDVVSVLYLVLEQFQSNKVPNNFQIKNIRGLNYFSFSTKSSGKTISLPQHGAQTAINRKKKTAI